MKNLVFCLLIVCLLPCVGLDTAEAATCYTNDGVLTGRVEAVRWFINRARYAPEMEADRLGLNNTTSGGHPDYDVCEDIDGTNDFGTNAVAWAPWKTSKPPLAPNATISTASQKHSQDMAETGVFSHYSPSTNYYSLSNSPSARLTQEGYGWSACGENIAMGTDWWMTPTQAHDAFFIDAGVVSRGHRKNILDYQYGFREIGLGYATGSGTNYYTEDFAYSGTIHFVTDTIFCDANSNGVYDEGEGVSNIEVRLWHGATQATWYDVSTASGNFAVPITDLPDNAEIYVQIVNKSGSARWLTMPMGFSTLGTFYLTNNQALFVSTYTQPVGSTNVGFRNTSPIIMMAAITPVGTNTVISFGPFMGLNYTVQSLDDLGTTNWITFATVVGSNSTSQVTDSGQGGRGAPASVGRRFYRVLMQKD